MFLGELAREWHESKTGLLSSLPDYWEIPQKFGQAGVPKTLERGEDFGYGLGPVRKRRLGYKHIIFSKRSPHMSATITQYIASQFAYHLDFPLAPILLGPNPQDMHSLRMVFNVKSGSLYEVLLEKIKKGDPDVPQSVLEHYAEYQRYNKKYRNQARVYDFTSFSTFARDNKEVGEWKDSFKYSVYGANRDTISRWVAFLAFIDDSESISNIGNVIVSMRDPKKILYFIDAHPNLQPGNSMSWKIPKGQKHVPVTNNGQYFLQTDGQRGNVDHDVISETLEGFKSKIDDSVIDDVIFKVSILAGRLLGRYAYGADPEYFRDLRDFYKSRRDTLECRF